MSKFGKVILIGLIMLYIVSPIDAVPGPIDDLIIGLIGYAAMKKRRVEET